MEKRIGEANDIGHLVLFLVAGISAFVFRGIPAWLWLIVYIFSALVAASVWKELENWTAWRWLLSAVIGVGATFSLYLVGTRFLGEQPWMVFKLFGMVAPMFALVSVSGFARTMYRRSDGSAQTGSSKV